jgi:Protein of unknown function (DUF2911)
MGGKWNFDLSVDYCSAGLRSSDEFSDLVPDDKVWPNDEAHAPIFSTRGDVKIGSLFLPAGKYSLYLLPRRGKWKLIVNKQLGEPAGDYDEGQTVGLLNMIAGPTPNVPIMRYEVVFEPTPGKWCSGCNSKDGPHIPASEFGLPQLHFKWGNIDVYTVIRPSATRVSTDVAASSLRTK